MLTSPSESELLLDTHFWLWLQAGDLNRMGLEATENIIAAAARGNLLLSIISVWEVGLLESKGRIELRKPIQQWMAEALDAPGLRLVPLSPEIAIDSTRLPGDFHADPVDRILVATARRLGIPLLTRDRLIIEYARRGHVSVR